MAGNEPVAAGNSGQFGGNQRRARAMHTAQHLAKGQVKSTEAGLNIGAPVPRLAVVMSLVRVCMILFVRCSFAGLHARMPS